jgi:hypothetical protein
MTPEQEQKLNDLYALISGLEDISEIEKKLANILSEQNKSISNFFNTQKEINKRIERRKNLEYELLKWKKEVSELNQLDQSLMSEFDKERLVSLNNYIAATQKSLNLLKEETEILSENSNIYNAIGNSIKDSVVNFTKLNFGIKTLYDYFIEFDSQVKNLNLNLAVTGQRADFFRNNIREAVNTVGHLGSSITDLIELQKELADITGISREYTESQLVMMNLIAKGTALSNNEASKLIGNAILLGRPINDIKDLIENSVNQFSKLGLNSNKVLKTVTSNVEKLDKYRFDSGLKGLIEMAKVSERFKMSIDGVLNSAEKFRTLEGLLETTATLNVLGGEFAKIDGFKFSFLARNKPEEFAKELAKLNKGFALFNQETGEFEVSDIGFDKLRVIAEATGRDYGELVKSAREFARLDLAQNQIFVGTDEEKEMIANLAQFSKGSRLGTITIDGKVTRLIDLNNSQLELLKQQNQTLLQRAEDARTFDDVYKNTISQIKSTLLPVLEIINVGLGLVNNVLDRFKDENGKLSKIGALIPIGGIILGSMTFAGLKAMLSSLGGFFGAKINSVFSTSTTSMSSASGSIGSVFNATMAANIAAMGVAAIGLGYGFKLASEGASLLATSFENLQPEKIEAFLSTVTRLGLFMGTTLIASVYALGAASTSTSLGLLAFGAASLMLGGGINLAANGLANLVSSFADLNNVNLSGLENSFSRLGGVVAASFAFGNPIAMAGFLALLTGLKSLSNVDLSNLSHLDSINKLLEKDLTNLKELNNIISKINILDSNKINELGNVLKNTKLKVEFDPNSQPFLNNYITLQIDGEKITKKTTNRVIISLKKGSNIR